MRLVVQMSWHWTPPMLTKRADTGRCRRFKQRWTQPGRRAETQLAETVERIRSEAAEQYRAELHPGGRGG